MTEGEIPVESGLEPVDPERSNVELERMTRPRRGSWTQRCVWEFPLHPLCCEQQKRQPGEADRLARVLSLAPSVRQSVRDRYRRRSVGRRWRQRNAPATVRVRLLQLRLRDRLLLV